MNEPSGKTACDVADQSRKTGERVCTCCHSEVQIRDVKLLSAAKLLTYFCNLALSQPSIESSCDQPREVVRLGGEDIEVCTGIDDVVAGCDVRFGGCAVDDHLELTAWQASNDGAVVNAYIDVSDFARNDIGKDLG